MMIAQSVQCSSSMQACNMQSRQIHSGPRRVFAPLSAFRMSQSRAMQSPPRRSSAPLRATNSDDNGRIPPQEQIWMFLNEKKFRSVSALDALELVESGEWAIVDVRPKDLHAQATISGAKSAPLFQKTDWSKPSFVKFLRAGALMANGVTPVEPNPDFLAEMKAAAGGKGVILACEAGGSTRPTPSFQFGKSSRSLSAAYRVLRSGVLEAEQVLHLEGGVYGWYKAQLPIDGVYDTENVGRTPNAASDAEYPGLNGKK